VISENVTANTYVLRRIIYQMINLILTNTTPRRPPPPPFGCGSLCFMYMAGKPQLRGLEL